MGKRGSYMLIVMIFLSLMSSVYAQEQKNVVFTLKDINTNAEINNAVVYLYIIDAVSDEYIYEGAVNINRSLDLILEDGSYKIILKADLPETPGMDYFKEHSFTLKNTLTQDVFLFPVGSLRGIVKDKLDNVVGYAELSFECVDDVGANFPEATSKFGSMAVDTMPTGSCKIFASYGDAMDFEEISLNRGELLDIEIKLNKSIIAPSKGYSDYILLAVVVVLAGLIIYLFKIRKKEKKLEKKVQKEIRKEKEEGKEIKKKEKEVTGKRAKDILPTLNAKERAVVNYLMKNKNQGSQSKIRHETGIPRTSLSRVLSSLEAKKIIKMEKHGKLVKVKLTPWFLGKE